MYGEEDLPDTSRVRTNQIVFRKDKHLSSALVITEIEYMMVNRANRPALKHEHRLLLEHMEKESWSLTHPSLFYSWCMQEALGSSKVHSAHTSEYNSLVRAAMTGHDAACQDWTHMEPASSVAPSTPLLLKIYDRKTQMDDLFDSVLCPLAGVGSEGNSLWQPAPGAPQTGKCVRGNTRPLGWRTGYGGCLV